MSDSLSCEYEIIIHLLRSTIKFAESQTAHMQFKRHVRVEVSWTSGNLVLDAGQAVVFSGMFYLRRVVNFVNLVVFVVSDV